ncbi:hypothetical protein F5Y11DRAFT_342339 [Daldinia sp. FL1419]|nr:hypothetical protein F5Y11DRAFT_342339 [Daldinia sp. FL1419]
MAPFKLFPPADRHHSKDGSPRSEQSESKKGYSYKDGDILLPGTGGVYLTISKSGKPALGRKKRDKSLEDPGFAFPGHELSFTSRMNAEKRARRFGSFYSQSSGVITPSPSTQSDTAYHPSYGQKLSPVETIGKDTLQSAFMSPSERIYHVNPGDTCSGESSGARKSSWFDTNANIRIRKTPMANTPSLLQSPSFWSLKDGGNGLVTMTPTPRLPSVSPSNPPIYAMRLSDYGGVQSLGQTKPLAAVSAVQHVQSPIFMTPQANSTRPYPQPSQYTVLYPKSIPLAFSTPGSGQAMPSAAPLVPVTPTRPATNLQQNESSRAASNNTVRFSPREAKDFELHYSTTTEARAEGKRDRGGKKEKTRIVVEEIGKYMQHIHFCAACGNRRSRGYQREHPLEIGQIPAPGYCRKCVRRATLKSKYGEDIDTTGDDTRQCARCTSYETTGTVTDDKPVDAKSWRNHKLKRRPARLILSPTISSHKAVRRNHVEAPLSTSSEESDFSISPPMPIQSPRKYHRQGGPPISPDEKYSTKFEISRNRQNRLSEKKLESTLKNVAPTKGSGTKTRYGPRGTKGSVIRSGRRRVPRDVYEDRIEAPPQATIPLKRRTRVPRPNATKAVSEVVPRFMPRAIPTFSEAVYSNREARDETYEDLDERFGRLSFLSKIQEPKRNHYTLNRKSPLRARDLTEYKPIHEKQSNSRLSVQEQHTSAMMTDTKQRNGGLRPSLREYSSYPQMTRSEVNTETGKKSQEHFGYTAEAEPDTPDTPTLPPTPQSPQSPGLPYTTTASVPLFTDEYWGIDKDWIEKSAQDLVEEELVADSKLFDDLAGGNWAEPSINPLFSPDFATRTEISVESLLSGEEQNGAFAGASTVNFQLADTSETGDDGQKGRLRKLSTSNKNGNSHTHNLRLQPHRDTWQRSGQSNPPEPSKKQPRSGVYSSYEGESGSGFSLLPPDPASSVAGQTGHSMEDTSLGIFDYHEPPTSGKWHNNLFSRRH